MPLRGRGGSKAGAGAGGAISGIAGNGTRKVLVDARLPLRGYLLLGTDGRRRTRRRRGTDSRLNSKGMFIIARSRDTGQILAGKVTEMDVLRADTLEAGDGLLGSTNGGELGDQVILAGLFDGLELRVVGMCQMVEIKGIGDETSLISVTLTRRPMTSKEIPHIELRLFLFPFTLIDLVKRGRDIELASLTTENATTAREKRLGDAILSLAGRGLRERRARHSRSILHGRGQRRRLISGRSHGRGRRATRRRRGGGGSGVTAGTTTEDRATLRAIGEGLSRGTRASMNAVIGVIAIIRVVVVVTGVVVVVILVGGGGGGGGPPGGRGRRVGGMHDGVFVLEAG